ncbi:unnamed protein product [Phytomonas sp. Hart1]|nr:unnamed protein product [Phytomonas sp. Hart1]|eukprot:CCW71530.1 unnamed protein product [Phytomonas sp. isolate Hart1]
MSNRHDSLYNNVSRPLESESLISGSFSPAIEEFEAKVADTLTSVFTAADSKVKASSAELQNIFQDLSSMRMDSSRMCRSHEGSARSHSTLSQSSIGACALPKSQVQHILRAPRTIQPTASQDIPLAILERMAYDTAASTLNFRGVSSFSVTPPSLGLNSDRVVLERGTHENQHRMSFSPEQSNRMAAASLAVSLGAEAPLTVISPALSHDHISGLSTSKSSDAPVKGALMTCLEHVINGNCTDEIDTRSLTRHDRDTFGNKFESRFTETVFNCKQLLESRNDGLNTISLENAHISSEKLSKRQILSDTHSIRLSVPELLDATKRHEPLCEMLSPGRYYSEKCLEDEGEGCRDLHEVLLGKPTDTPRLSFSKSKEVHNSDRLIPPGIRVHCPTFHPVTPTPTQCRDLYGTHHCACIERNNAMTACAFNNSKRGREVTSIGVTPEGASTGTISLSLAHHKDTSSVQMEPFQTWSFPTLFKTVSSCFQSPLDDPLTINTNGDAHECFPVDGEGNMIRKEGRGLSLGLNHSPRVKIQPDFTCTDEQSGSFSIRLEATRNTWSKLSRIHNELAGTSHRSDEEIQDANQQLLLRPIGNLQRQGHDTGSLPFGTKDNIEFLRAWEMVYSAYMRNCSTHFGCSKIINSYEDYTSFDSSRACQDSGLGAGNFFQKNFQGTNSFDSHKHACSYSIPTPSMSVSGALSRSSGYYSFGNRLSLHHPNYQKMGFIPQYLGSFFHTQTPSQSPSARTTKERQYTNVKMQHQEKSHMIMDPAVVASIQRRPLLLTTVFLRYAWILLGKSSRSGGDTNDVAESCSEHLPSTANVNGGPSCIPESSTQTNQLHNTFSNNYCTGPTPRRNSSSNLSLSLTVPNDKIEKAIEANTSVQNILTPNHYPLVHVCEISNEKKIEFPINDVESKLLTREVAADSSDFHREAISPQHSSPRSSTQNVFRITSPSFQEQHRLSLTQFKKIVRHQHSIDNFEREVDNESNDLIVYVGTRLMGWLEVVALLGSGSFGQVFLCIDLRVSSGRFVHPSAIGGEDFAYWSCSHEYLPLGDCDIPPAHFPLVAVKVVKSIPLFEHQSVLEAEMLVLIGVQTASNDSFEAASPMSRTQSFAFHPPPSDPRCTFVGKILAHGVCYGHHCIVMERYGANLYEYIQSHQHNGLPMYQIRSIAKQLLSALTLLHENCRIIHADIKPENLLLTLDSCRGMHSNNHMQQNRAKLTRSVTPATTEVLNTGQYTADFLNTHNDEESHYFRGKSVTSNVECSSTPPSAANLKARSDDAAVPSMHCLVCSYVDASTLSEPLTVRSLKRRSRTQSAERTCVVEPKLQQLHDLNHTLSLNQSTSDSVLNATKLPVDSLLCSSSLETSMHDTTSFNIPQLHIKLIDFSSSCYDAGPFYSYIQSRYYRAPEIIVNASYGPPIDLWSTGCVLVELLLGMPLLPGCNDHHQLTLIEEMVGPLPASLLECGDSTHIYYDKHSVEDVNSHGALPEDGPTCSRSTTAETSQAWKKAKTGQHVDRPTHDTTYSYKLVSKDDFFTKNNLPIVEYKRYFTCKTLQELVRQCPLPLAEKRMGHGLQPYVSSGESSDIPSDSKLSETVCNELMRQRFWLYDLLRKLLNPDPQMRLTAAQALLHPFISSDLAHMQQFGLE